MSELESCPFCGGEAEIWGSPYGYAILCSECLVETITYKTKSEAIAAWNRRAEPRWIPCSERLPNKPIRVQTQLDNEWIVTAYYYDNTWYTVPDLGQGLKNDEIIAWMPLPKPWKG